MNGLASVAACSGLFENSPAIVIGAMIIAMLLGPIAGIFRRALATLAAGFAMVYGTAFVLGLMHSDVPLTHEIYARGQSLISWI
jgi:uncharacterized membrane protein